MHKITCFLPLDSIYASYQFYYQQGLIDLLGRKQIEYRPIRFNINKLLTNKNVKRLDYYLISKVFKYKCSPLPPFCDSYSVTVGQYIMHRSDGKKIKFAIDVHDHRDINSQAILDWSDIYFKSNRWKECSYPEKVHPIVNGNGSITPSTLEFLKSLRSVPKELDLVFISRVWGTSDHDVRIFEQLAELKCKKELLAIFPKPINKSQQAMQDKLDQVGVPWTYQYVPQKKLWMTMAKAKVVVLRTGHHHCIPWRMIDLLALGACVIYDNDPNPSWPVPLQDQVNYISLGLASPMEKNCYLNIQQIIKNVLKSDSLQNMIRTNNIKYFTNFASPDKVGESIITLAEKF